ncbi:hypothetical protein WCN79_04130 [Xanthomonas axonopodis pv. vasculorum]|uniref:hypothetical protein n=1 Tax=Xanthomonas axonopodis TaxID=53413 RepID=UPI001070C3AD|nr:hypothetical protein [Xanthomonas axonopodis]QKD88044.1 hypothetical protein XAV_19100 [Xanthomonas axonopodis pv. vasculorum]
MPTHAASISGDQKFAAVQLKILTNQSLPSGSTTALQKLFNAHLQQRNAQNGGKVAASAQVREPFGSLE